LLLAADLDAFLTGAPLDARTERLVLRP
jgi:hypothetical protein